LIEGDNTRFQFTLGTKVYLGFSHSHYAIAGIVASNYSMASSFHTLSNSLFTGDSDLLTK
jgi:hypothetical protein